MSPEIGSLEISIRLEGARQAASDLASLETAARGAEALLGNLGGTAERQTASLDAAARAARNLAGAQGSLAGSLERSAALAAQAAGAGTVLGSGLETASQKGGRALDGLAGALSDLVARNRDALGEMNREWTGDSGTLSWERAVSGTVSVIQDSLDDGFTGFLSGELDDAGDLFKSLADRVLGLWVAMLAEMVAEWAASGLASLFSGEEGGGGITLNFSSSSSSIGGSGGSLGGSAGASAGSLAGGYAGSQLGQAVGGDTGGRIGGVAGSVAGAYGGQLLAGYAAEALGLTAAQTTAASGAYVGGMLTTGGAAAAGVGGPASAGVGGGIAASADISAAVAANAAAAGASAGAGSAAGATAVGAGMTGGMAATGIGIIIAAIMAAGQVALANREHMTPETAREELETYIEDLKRPGGGFGMADDSSYLNSGYPNRRAAIMNAYAQFSGTSGEEFESMLEAAGVAWDEFEARVMDFSLADTFKKTAQDLGRGTETGGDLAEAARKLSQIWGISQENALNEVYSHSLAAPLANNSAEYERALTMLQAGVTDLGQSATNASIQMGDVVYSLHQISDAGYGTADSIQSLTGALDANAAAALTATEVEGGLYSLTMQLGQTSLETTASLDVFKEGVGFAAQSMLDAGDAAFSLGELIGGLPTEHTINVTTRYTTVGTPSEVPLGGDGESAGDIPAFHQGGAVPAWMASLASLPAYHSGGEVLARLLPGEDVWSREDIARHGGLGAVEALRKGGRAAQPKGGDTISNTYTFNVETRPGQDNREVSRDLMRRIKRGSGLVGRERPARQTVRI